MRHLLYTLILSITIIILGGCANETMEFDNPNVELFIKQLKDGTYNLKNEYGVVAVPRFKEKDIPELLEHADDMTLIPTFPTIYNTSSGKIRLGECLLWIVESLRLGMPPSMGCHMVDVYAENYEAIYFLTDEQVEDAVERYRFWWENRKYPHTVWTIDPCRDEPLCGSGYRWW
jgi:hypothetical protein